METLSCATLADGKRALKEEQKFEKVILKTKAYYTSITSLEFHPMKMKEKLEVEIKKGERYWWKLLGLIRFIPSKAKEDLYSTKKFDFEWPSKYANFKDIFKSAKYNELVTKEGLFYKPYVKINRRIENSETIFFENNEEAYEYMNNLKKKCKECGNLLT